MRVLQLVSMLALCLSCALLALELESAAALDNGRAITPPMGYVVSHYFRKHEKKLSSVTHSSGHARNNQ